jgi:hypothetical protein
MNELQKTHDLISEYEGYIPNLDDVVEGVNGTKTVAELTHCDAEPSLRDTVKPAA